MMQPDREALAHHLHTEHFMRERILADMSVSALGALHKEKHPDGEPNHHTDPPNWWERTDASEELRHIRLTQPEYDSLFGKKEAERIRVDCDIPEWANYGVVLGYGDEETRVLFRVTIAEVTSLIEREAAEKVLASAQVFIKVGATPDKGRS